MADGIELGNLNLELKKVYDYVLKVKVLYGQHVR